jgi:hypothetical protein
MKKTCISRRQLLQGLFASTGLAVVTPMRSVPSAPASARGEWTFEEAKRCWIPMTRAVQHVGVPGCEWQAGVLWDGALVFGPEKAVRVEGALAKEVVPLGNNLLHVSVGYGNPPRFMGRGATRDAAVRRGLEDGRLPMPHLQTQNGALVWNEVAYGHLLDRKLEEGMDPRDDDLLVVQVRFTVRNTADHASQGHLWLHFGDTSQVQLGYKAGEGAELGPALSHRFESPFGVVGDDVRYVIAAPRKGSIRWHDEVAAPEGMKSQARNVLEWDVPLAPGEEAGCDLTIPYRPVNREIAERLSRLERDRLFDETRGFWEKTVRSRGSIITPDPFVNDYVAAVLGQMAQQVAYRHKAQVWMYKTSPNHYEMYWPCNAAKALPTFDLRGLTRFSRPVLKSFVATQSEDVGSLTKERREGKGEQVAGEGFARRPGFLGNFGDWTANTLLLNHGLELWALASHYRITRDRDWLGRGPGSPLHAILEACDWIATQRRRTMREENGRKVPHWGLFPAASAHDWLSGNTIFNDAFCIFGMMESVRLLREIDHARVEEMAHELNDYRACLRERYREARDRARRVPMPDGTELPYVPRDVYELDWAKTDWTYTGYGPLRAGAWGALDPHDELVNQALAFVEAGMPQGEGFYLTMAKDGFEGPTADENFRDISDPKASRHFLWRHYVEYETMWPIGFDLFLQRDDLPRFFEWFFHNLSVVIHHDFRVGVESLDGVPSCAPGDGERWRAIRNMFVNERGGYDGSQQSLWLLQAIPRSWLKPGSRLSIQQTGTHFGGLVDLEAEVAKDGNSILVSTDVNLAVLPTEVRMRLRSGDGRPLASAQVNGRKIPVLEKDTITIPTETQGKYRIVGRFA